MPRLPFDLTLPLGCYVQWAIPLSEQPAPGRELRMQIRERIDSDAPLATLQSGRASPGVGMLSVDNIGSEYFALATLPATVTELITLEDPTGAVAVYDLEAYDPNDPAFVEKLAFGACRVIPNVTR